MRLFASLFIGLMLTTVFSSASGQGSKETREKGQSPARSRPATQTADAESKAPAASTTPIQQDKLAITIHLVGGGQVKVDEVRESAEGFWYKTGNVTTLLDKARVKRIERPARPEDIQPRELGETFAGNWSINDSPKVEKFFMTKFDRRLPTTAFGQSELHTRWGLDHREGIDVGLHPDSPEGRALIDFLRSEKIPFLAFRVAVPGVATGPHIHIGRGSHRMPLR
jgi:hypothetical protein